MSRFLKFVTQFPVARFDEPLADHGWLARKIPGMDPRIEIQRLIIGPMRKRKRPDGSVSRRFRAKTRLTVAVRKDGSVALEAVGVHFSAHDWTTLQRVIAEARAVIAGQPDLFDEVGEMDMLAQN